MLQLFLTLYRQRNFCSFSIGITECKLRSIARICHSNAQSTVSIIRHCYRNIERMVYRSDTFVIQASCVLGYRILIRVGIPAIHYCMCRDTVLDVFQHLSYLITDISKCDVSVSIIGASCNYAIVRVEYLEGKLFVNQIAVFQYFLCFYTGLAAGSKSTLCVIAVIKGHYRRAIIQFCICAAGILCALASCADSRRSCQSSLSITAYYNRYFI